MWSLSVLKLLKRKRKYPIQRDQFGRTGRKRAFDAFDRGLRPAQVAREENIKPRTCFRYFQDWKKLPENLESEYRAFKALKKRGIDIMGENIELLAAGLGMSQEEVRRRLQKPWGLKTLLMGKWPNKSRRENSN